MQATETVDGTAGGGSTPAACSGDPSPIYIYDDKSYSAAEMLQANMERIAEEADALQRLRNFINENKDILAGLSWRVVWYEAEIELSHSWYRGRKIKPSDVAGLWPKATWKREKEKYSGTAELRRNWVAEIDGVKLTIRDAESYLPAIIPPDGEVILPSRNGSSRNSARAASGSRSREASAACGPMSATSRSSISRSSNRAAIQTIFSRSRKSTGPTRSSPTSSKAASWINDGAPRARSRSGGKTS